MKNKATSVIFCVSLCFFQFIFFGQDKEIDSMLNILQTKAHDTIKIKTLIQLSNTYTNFNPDSAIIFANQALVLCEKADRSQEKGSAYNCLGNSYADLSEYDKALEYHLRSLKIREDLGNKRGMAGSFNNIGMIYRSKGDNNKALEYYFKALKINEEIDNKAWIAINYHNIAAVYGDFGQKEKEVEFLLKSMKIREEINDRYNLAASYHNVGNFYANGKESDKALEYYFKAIKINEEFKNKIWLSNNYAMIAHVFSNKAKYDKALEYYDKAKKLLEEVGDKDGIANLYNSTGLLYQKLNKPAEALNAYQQGVVIATEIDSKPMLKNLYFGLSSLYSKTGNWKEAFNYQKMYSAIKDTLLNTESTKHLAEMLTKFESEKKDAEIKLLNKDNEIAASENKKQKSIIYSVIGGLILVVVFSIFVFNRWRLTQKQKRIIEDQKERVDKAYSELDSKNQIIEIKNKEITASINYAKRIQGAILSKEEDISRHFSESFLLYEPKDIVAGDFYFFEVSENHIFYAAADCTGHGVPGALVSVVCSNALTRCVKEFALTEPGKILDKTTKLILETFKKSGQEIKDGMDISLLVINTKSNTYQWSGANNPLWYLQNKNIKEITADKQPVGLSENPRPFTTHSLNLNKGDTLFLFTDGYADQFGGLKGKKFKYKQLQDILVTESNNLAETKNILTRKFHDWKGKLEQVDDVCIIGIRI